MFTHEISRDAEETDSEDQLQLLAALHAQGKEFLQSFAPIPEAAIPPAKASRKRKRKGENIASSSRKASRTNEAAEDHDDEWKGITNIEESSQSEFNGDETEEGEISGGEEQDDGMFLLVHNSTSMAADQDVT